LAKIRAPFCSAARSFVRAAGKTSIGTVTPPAAWAPAASPPTSTAASVMIRFLMRFMASP